MAWTNADYMTKETPALRLAAARAFHTEIINQITADVSSDGKSKGNSPLTTLLERVTKDIERLEGQTGSFGGSRVSSLRFGSRP